MLVLYLLFIRCIDVLAIILNNFFGSVLWLLMSDSCCIDFACGKLHTNRTFKERSCSCLACVTIWIQGTSEGSQIWRNSFAVLHSVKVKHCDVWLGSLDKELRLKHQGGVNIHTGSSFTLGRVIVNSRVTVHAKLQSIYICWVSLVLLLWLWNWVSFVVIALVSSSLELNCLLLLNISRKFVFTYLGTLFYLLIGYCSMVHWTLLTLIWWILMWTWLGY